MAPFSKNPGMATACKHLRPYCYVCLFVALVLMGFTNVATLNVMLQAHTMLTYSQPCAVLSMSISGTHPL